MNQKLGSAKVSIIIGTSVIEQKYKNQIVTVSACEYQLQVMWLSLNFMDMNSTV